MLKPLFLLLKLIMESSKNRPLSTYSDDHLNRVAFPLGGIGSGMLCLEGTGALSHVSLRHHPDIYDEPMMFSALYIEGANTARVLEGPVPMWKAFGSQGASGVWPGCGTGLGGRSYGLPRFSKALFTTRFPFGTVHLSDDSMPVSVDLTGWSPFIPSDADNSSLPVAALEFRIRNTTKKPVSGVYSFHSDNFMRTEKDGEGRISSMKNGFILEQPPIDGKPADEGAFAAFITDPDTKADCAWYRGGWFDSVSMAWKHVADGDVVSRKPYAEGRSGSGASLYLPFTLLPKQEKTICLKICWFVPRSKLRVNVGSDREAFPNGIQEADKFKLGTYTPWYAGRFKDIQEVANYWKESYENLREQSASFSDCFFDSTLPPEVLEAVAANLSILKSPTCLRQADGRFWGWEGCGDQDGSCAGSCTHVWNYAQAMPHLFPSLERTLRETELFHNQNEQGHQNFRASLPVGTPPHDHHAAADGQLGGLIKLYRDWRISGDTRWMKSLLPKAKMSLDYCIATWDPNHRGILEKPHHNTYDIEFWSQDGMCTSFYLAGLLSFIAMSQEAGEDAAFYEKLLAAGKAYLEKELYNGEYFVQEIVWDPKIASNPAEARKLGVSMNDTKDEVELIKNEGPKYQYGKGCLSDGIIGEWMGWTSGLDPIVAPKKIKSHLMAVYQHNFRTNLSSHANPQRPGYAFGQEGGLLLCTWPRGGKHSLPFPYSDEVWTGIEYQVASHLIERGALSEGLELVKAVRRRYDGRHRNPFNEYECGHWYARAMASYALLQACSGARYDAVTQSLTLRPKVPGDFRCFLAFEGGYGTVGVCKGKPFLEIKSGTINVLKIDFEAAEPLS